MYLSPNCIGTVSIKQIQLFHVNLTAIKVKKIPEYLWSISHYFTNLPALRYINPEESSNMFMWFCPLYPIYGDSSYALQQNMCWIPRCCLKLTWVLCDARRVLCPEPWCLFLEFRLRVLRSQGPHLRPEALGELPSGYRRTLCSFTLARTQSIWACMPLLPSPSPWTTGLTGAPAASVTGGMFWHNLCSTLALQDSLLLWEPFSSCFYLLKIWILVNNWP